MKNFKKNNLFPVQKKSPQTRALFGKGGIRTLGNLRYTRFPSVLLRPLGHLSFFIYSIVEMIDSQTLSDPLFASMLFKRPSFL